MIRRIIKALQNRFSKQSEIQALIDKGMTVGENCAFFSTSTIDSLWPWLISFGNNVTVSTNVTILAHDASPNVVGLGTKLGKVRIGNNVFIGTGSIILCNTSIGDNVIIGAGSVVSGIVESNSVYYGVPAKKHCTLDEYKERVKEIKKDCPDLGRIHKWNEWGNASAEEKKHMSDLLGDRCSFI